MWLSSGPVICLLLLFAVIHTSWAQAPTADFDRSGGAQLKVLESEGYVQVCVNLTNATTVLDRITVSTTAPPSPGSATANIDFVSTQVTLIFEVGDIRQCLNITVLDDKIEEGNVGETFYVQLVPASGSSDHIIFYINNLYGIVIEDSDILLLGFTQPVYQIMEDSTQEVCITIMNNIILEEGVDVRVMVSTDPTSGDYSVSTSSLSFNSDPTTQSRSCFNVTIQDDPFIEGTESFELVLSQEDIDEDVAFVDNSATVMILDSDGATLELSQTLFEVVEGDLAMRTTRSVCVILANDQSGLERDIVLNVETVTDTATSGVDFLPLSTTLTIPLESQMGASTCVEFTVFGDDQREADEDFMIIFTPITPDVFADGADTVNVIIEDDSDTLDCRTLLGPPDGAVDQQGSTIGSMAVYECDANFELIPADSMTRTCEENNWTGEDPRCVAMCRTLEVEYGEIILSNNTRAEGTVAYYNCIENFELRGTNNRTCQSDGEWSGNDPTCEAITCGRLDNILNGGVRHENLVVGSIAAYSCTSGFMLEGNENRVCRADRLWDGTEPICIALPPNPDVASEERRNIGLGVGIGVGVPLLLFALIVIITVYLVRHVNTVYVVENRKTKPPFSVVYQVPTPTTTTAAETAGTSQPEDSQIATI